MTSFGEVLAQLEKLGEIKTSPRQLFTYLQFPEELSQRFESIARHVVPEGKAARDIDHVTLLYIPKAEADIAHDRVDEILRKMRDVCEHVRPIKAKVQGWAYFDGALEDGVKKTALVGLIDAPGLEDLHVELKSALRQLGLDDAGTHGFTPHVTFAYLDHGERVKDLPMLDGEFDIDRVMFANADKHEIRLLGDKNMGEKAAMHFGHQVAAGMKVEHTPGRTAEKAKSIVLARLRKDPQFYIPTRVKQKDLDRKIHDEGSFWRAVDTLDKRSQPKQAGVVVEADEAGMKALFDRLYRAMNGGAPMPEKSAERVDRCKVCDKKATVKVLWAEGHGYQPACEAHKEQVAKPFKDKDDFSGFKRYKTAEAIGMCIRDGRGYGPYEMGYYHDATSGDSLPYGPNGEKLSKDYDYRPGPKGFLTGRREPLKKVAEFSLSTSAVRQEPREKDDYQPGGGTSDAGGTGGVVDSKVTRHDDDVLAEAFRNATKG